MGDNKEQAALGMVMASAKIWLILSRVAGVSGNRHGEAREQIDG